MEVFRVLETRDVVSWQNVIKFINKFDSLSVQIFFYLILSVANATIRKEYKEYNCFMLRTCIQIAVEHCRFQGAQNENATKLLFNIRTHFV